MRSRLTKLGEIYLEYALQYPRLYELMFLKPRGGARRYPQDFRAGRSATTNPTVEVIREGMESGYLRKDDAWEIVFEMSALSHGLIMLYLGGRVSVPLTHFRAVYRHSFRRYIRGIRK